MLTSKMFESNRLLILLKKEISGPLFPRYLRLNRKVQYFQKIGEKNGYFFLISKLSPVGNIHKSNFRDQLSHRSFFCFVPEAR